MANIKANAKSNKQGIERNERNKSFKSRIKTAIKTAQNTKSEEDKNLAISLIDKAVNKNIFKKNKAARLKSRIHNIKKES